ncbi:MAG: hypothetical protein ACK5QX_06550, partial [bacterium]
MTITTEQAEQMAEICDQLGGFAQCAAALRSLAAERDALKAENEKLRTALRGVLTYYSAPTPAEAKLKKAVLA